MGESAAVARPSGARLSVLRRRGSDKPARARAGQTDEQEYSFLLPAALRDSARTGSGPRTMRDWFVDVLCFLASMSWAVSSAIDLARGEPSFVRYSGTPHWLLGLDLTLGVGFSVALWWRRRWPVLLTVGVLLLGFLAVTTAVAATILALTVAVHRSVVTTLALFTVSAGSNALFYLVRPEPQTLYAESVAWSIGVSAIVMLWGMVVRARRELVLSLRDRAERAESEQQARIDRARALERNRIAREMHDVLAHRITLLSLHAGGLEVAQGQDATPEVKAAAGVIRGTAHEIMNDLRFVIGVLREPGDDDGTERPQPTLGDVPALAEESRRAGAKVALTLDVPAAATLPAGTGRTIYRIVQEGLTNARKHAPGTTVEVRVRGTPSEGLTVALRNPPVVGRGIPAVPGTGSGLVGLHERAELAGGTLRHGPDPDGGFSLQAWLPWSS